MIKRILYFIVLMWFCLFHHTFGQIVIVDTLPVEELILQNFPGDGVEISNITFQGSQRQFGLFENANTVLGIQRGIVMCSGEAALSSTTLATGSNSEFNDLDDATSADILTPGDGDLDSISGSNTFNAAVIGFDFVPNSSQVRFRYVFASEEYPEFNCTDFNDVFAFILTGPGFPVPENIAKIPGTDFVVSINTINNGTVGSVGGDIVNCTEPQGSLANSAFYVDNTGGMWLEFDGMTIVLETTAEVIPCETYHFKLAIADVFDNFLESAVFLESQSFTSAGLQVEVADLTGDSSMVEGCSDIRLTFTFAEPLTNPTEISYVFSGTAEEGSDFTHNLQNTIVFASGEQVKEFVITPLADDIPESAEDLFFIFQNPACQLDPDTIALEIFDRGMLTVSPQFYTACADEGEQVQLLAQNTTHPYGTYTWSPTTGLSDPGIANPVAFISGDVAYSVTHEFGNCTDSEILTITAEPCFQIYVPNVFSPDGDGVNDFFGIQYPVDVQLEFELYIFDRTGAEVYFEQGSNLDIPSGWDGTIKGEPAFPGVYTYLITLTINQNVKKMETGSVTLIR